MPATIARRRGRIHPGWRLEEMTSDRGGGMPWLSEEIPEWEEMTDEDRDVLRDCLRDLGMVFPIEEDGDGYCE
jgi:hypothetical protein